MKQISQLIYFFMLYFLTLDVIHLMLYVIHFMDIEHLTKIKKKTYLTGSGLWYFYFCKRRLAKTVVFG
jgi:hypothetical protein